MQNFVAVKALTYFVEILMDNVKLFRSVVVVFDNSIVIDMGMAFA